MATIFELSPYNLYRLQSLDPVLDENYRDILEVIFPILDEKSQDMLLTRHLHPIAPTGSPARKTGEF